MQFVGLAGLPSFYKSQGMVCAGTEHAARGYMAFTPDLPSDTLDQSFLTTHGADSEGLLGWAGRRL